MTPHVKVGDRLRRVREKLRTIQLNAAGKRGVEPGMWDHCHEAATRALAELPDPDSVEVKGSDAWEELEETCRQLEQQRDDLAADKARLEREHNAIAKRMEELAIDRDDWHREFEMYRKAWIRELGGRLVQKTHEIDALVLTTQSLRDDVRRSSLRLCAAALSETRTRSDVEGLIEKWSSDGGAP